MDRSILRHLGLDRATNEQSKDKEIKNLEEIITLMR